MSITKFILVFCHLPVLAVMIYSMVIYARLKKEIKPLAWYLAATGILYAVSLLLWFLNLNNLPLLHVLVPLRFVLLVLIYKEILSSYIPSWVLYALAGGFCLYSFVNTLFVESWDTFNARAMTVESTLLIILSLSTYIFLMDKRMTKHLDHYLKSVEWINSGVFLYYSSSLVLMYFGKYMIQLISPELSRYTWVVHSFFLVIMYYCFWRALWKQNTT